MHFDRAEALRRAAAADHGVLATMQPSRGADLVPACFAIVDDWLAVPIDSVKPKGSTALGRIRNLERDPRATLLVEHWDPADWSKLWWVRVDGRASLEERGEAFARALNSLRDRYPQYESVDLTGPVIRITVESTTTWEATPG